MTKPAKLRELEGNELERQLGETRKELFNLRFQLATGRLDNISRITNLRKDIARLLTISVEREQQKGGR